MISKHRNSLFILHRDTLAVQVATHSLKRAPKSWAMCTNKFEIAGELHMALDAMVSPASREAPACDQGDLFGLMLSSVSSF